jgi:acyl-CoA synthetase (NDP forming)
LTRLQDPPVRALTGSADLHALFNPRAVAVVGASGRSGTLNSRPLSILREWGFGGTVYPVNPSYPELDGQRCYSSISDLPTTPDVAYILVPGAAVEGVVADCGAKGIKFAIISSSGFGETASGIAAEERLRDSARRSGIRLVGPNSEGIWSVAARLPLTFGSAAMRPDIREAPVAIVSQSGSVGAAVVQRLLDRGLGCNYLVSSGNEVDLDVADFIDFLAADASTRVILCFFEGISNSIRLRSAAHRAREAGKVVVALKPRGGVVTRAAMASHTGRIVGDDAAYDALFRQSGILRVESIEDLEMAARVFVVRGRPIDRGVAVLSMSGGARALIVAGCEDAAIAVPQFASGTRSELRAELPAYASSDNPIDLTGEIINRPELFETCLEMVARDPNTDCVVLQLANRGRDDASRLLSAVGAVRRDTGKTVVMSLMAGLPPQDVMIAYASANVAVVDDPGKVGMVLGWISTQQGLQSALPDIGNHEEAAAAGSSRELLDELGTHEDLQIPAARIVDTPASAIAAAEELGYPVVLKMLTEDVMHKTEAGGVHIGLRDRSSVVQAFNTIERSGQSRVLVQRMVTAGVEVLIAVKQLQDLGRCLVFGWGGVTVELQDDVSCRILPVAESDLVAMIGETRVGRVLNGYRGGPHYDIPAVVRTLQALAQMALRYPGQDIEVNPLIVKAGSGGAWAVDWRITKPAQRGRPEPATNTI